jgi:hypothetical protein
VTIRALNCPSNRDFRVIQAQRLTLLELLMEQGSRRFSL